MLVPIGKVKSHLQTKLASEVATMAIPISFILFSDSFSALSVSAALLMLLLVVAVYFLFHFNDTYFCDIRLEDKKIIIESYNVRAKKQINHIDPNDILQYKTIKKGFVSPAHFEITRITKEPLKYILLNNYAESVSLAIDNILNQKVK